MSVEALVQTHQSRPIILTNSNDTDSNKQHHYVLAFAPTLSLRVQVAQCTPMNLVNRICESWRYFMDVLNGKDLLDLIIQHQHNGTTGTAENVGASALEESTHALVGSNLTPAVQSTLVHLLLGTRLQVQPLTG